jgi:two-component system OmpR family response regulator
VHRRTEWSVAARTETVEYPRSAGGRRQACAASLLDAFHAASSTPSASQLSDASRCCAHHVSVEPHRPAPPAPYREPRAICAVEVVMASLLVGVSRLEVSAANRDSCGLKSGEPKANDGESWQPHLPVIGYDSTMKKHIAIVEDEPALRENYAAALARHGYAIKTYGNRKNAMQAFHTRLPDLAIIDISLEDEAEGGFDLCRELRALSAELPIIFLTARDSELDAVSGLRLGADDFLTKDVSLPHLAARVAALFRRIDALRRPDNAAEIVRRGALSIDAEKMQTLWNGAPVTLSLTEFWIVHALARNPGHVKNRQQLMDAANVVLDDNTITSHIKRMRRKFQQIDPAFDAIQTVYGMGYRWVE